MLQFPANLLRKTIFTRLLFTYFIVILPIILLGIYLYYWSYSYASQETSRNTLAQLSSYLEDLNREIEWLEIQQLDLLQDSEINKIAVTWNMMDNVEKKESMNYVVHRLTSVKNTSAYIKDIYIHGRTINKTISAINAVNELDTQKFNYFRPGTDKESNRLINWKDTLNLSASKFGGKKGLDPLFIVQIELDMDKLKDSLRQVNLYPESRSFLLSETSGFTLINDAESNPIMQKYMNEANGTSGSTLLVDVEGRKFHIDKAFSDRLGLSVVTYIPEETVRRPLNKFYIWAWLFSIMSLAAIVIYSYSTFKFVHKPLLLLVQSFRRMEEGTLDILIQHEKKDEFGYLYSRFNQMLMKLQSLIDQDYKQKLMMQKAELKQLQSQINPHFLYNSFFILNSLAKVGDVDRIELFTNMLGEYFRFITRNGEDNVLLLEEIKHSRMYTEIQKLRFSRRIKVQFDDLPKEMEQIRVPRLIVQPIIENAYEHSLEKMTEEGHLRVSFRIDHSEALVMVEDNGSISDAEMKALQSRLASFAESHEMTGIINIHRRILLTYGEGSGLFLSRSELGGLKAVIRIKLPEEDWGV